MRRPFALSGLAIACFSLPVGSCARFGFESAHSSSPPATSDSSAKVGSRDASAASEGARTGDLVDEGLGARTDGPADEDPGALDGGPRGEGAAGDAGTDRGVPSATVDGGPCGGPCAAGLDCVDGSCRCVSGGSCRGCCANNTTCVEEVTVQQCGGYGSACFACDPQRACDCFPTIDGGYCSCTTNFAGPTAPPQCEVGQACVLKDNGPLYVCVPVNP